MKRSTTKMLLDILSFVYDTGDQGVVISRIVVGVGASHSEIEDKIKLLTSQQLLKMNENFKVKLSGKITHRQIKYTITIEGIKMMERMKDFEKEVKQVLGLPGLI